jgi:hypothetical protein
MSSISLPEEQSMAIIYSPPAQEFLQTLEGKNLEITQALLQMIADIGIEVEARYYQKIIVINLQGIDLWGISPRKTAYSLYLFDLEAKHRFLKDLGKIDDGVGCLRFKKWTDINPEALQDMFRWMLQNPKNYYGNISDQQKQKQ